MAITWQSPSFYDIVLVLTVEHSCCVLSTQCQPCMDPQQKATSNSIHRLNVGPASRRKADGSRHIQGVGVIKFKTRHRTHAPLGRVMIGTPDCCLATAVRLVASAVP